MAGEAETTMRERHAAPLYRGVPLPFDRAQLQVGTNWCWAAITASLEEQRTGTPVRQCDVVQATLKAPQVACHLSNVGGADLRPTRCDPRQCTVRRDADLLREQAAEAASVMGQTWIEGLEIAVAAPAAAAADGGPLAELRRLIEDDILPGEGFIHDIAGIASALRGQLPPECRAMFGSEEADVAAAIAALAREGVEEVLARLRAGAAGDA
jgi:hypothetical protein